MSRELLSPVAKRRFANGESYALFAHRSDDEVDMWMALVDMQRHRIAMLKRKSVQGERVPPSQACRAAYLSASRK